MRSKEWRKNLTASPSKMRAFLRAEGWVPCPIWKEAFVIDPIQKDDGYVNSYRINYAYRIALGRKAVRECDPHE